MGLQDTRVKNKKGQIIITLTNDVTILVNNIAKFEESIKAAHA